MNASIERIQEQMMTSKEMADYFFILTDAERYQKAYISLAMAHLYLDTIKEREPKLDIVTTKVHEVTLLLQSI